MNNNIKQKFQKTQTNRKKIPNQKVIPLVKAKTNTILIYAIEAGFVKTTHITILHQTLKNSIKKKSKIVLIINPINPRTKKALGSRIGKGKGSVSFFDIFIIPGTVICSIANVKSSYLKSSLLKTLKKIPIRITVLSKKKTFLK